MGQLRREGGGCAWGRGSSNSIHRLLTNNPPSPTSYPHPAGVDAGGHHIISLNQNSSPCIIHIHYLHGQQSIKEEKQHLLHPQQDQAQGLPQCSSRYNYCTNQSSLLLSQRTHRKDTILSPCCSYSLCRPCACCTVRIFFIHHYVELLTFSFFVNTFSPSRSVWIILLSSTSSINTYNRSLMVKASPPRK